MKRRSERDPREATSQLSGAYPSRAAANLVSDFERHSPERQFHLSADDLDDHYADTVEITIHHCVQEAVTNTLRHGKASNVSIRLGVKSRKVGST